MGDRYQWNTKHLESGGKTQTNYLWQNGCRLPLYYFTLGTELEHGHSSQLCLWKKPHWPCLAPFQVPLFWPITQFLFNWQLPEQHWTLPTIANPYHLSLSVIIEHYLPSSAIIKMSLQLYSRMQFWSSNTRAWLCSSAPMDAAGFVTEHAHFLKHVTGDWMKPFRKRCPTL